MEVNGISKEEFDEKARLSNKKMAERIANALSDLKNVLDSNLQGRENNEIKGEVIRLLYGRFTPDRFRLSDYFKSILDDTRGEDGS